MKFSEQYEIADKLYKQYTNIGINCFYVFGEDKKTIKFFEIDTNKEICTLYFDEIK
ncbi:MAG: hypothetical protein KHZ27_10535 [Fusobacterium sp.]|nr:hypothetical protein [Fusobacterium sp.]